MAFVRELPKETIHLPRGCLQSGTWVVRAERHPRERRERGVAPPPEPPTVTPTKIPPVGVGARDGGREVRGGAARRAELHVVVAETPLLPMSREAVQKRLDRVNLLLPAPLLPPPAPLLLPIALVVVLLPPGERALIARVPVRGLLTRWGFRRRNRLLQLQAGGDERNVELWRRVLARGAGRGRADEALARAATRGVCTLPCVPEPRSSGTMARSFSRKQRLS